MCTVKRGESKYFYAKGISCTRYLVAAGLNILKSES